MFEEKQSYLVSINSQLMVFIATGVSVSIAMALILFSFSKALITANLDLSDCCTPKPPGHDLISQLEFISLVNALS